MRLIDAELLKQTTERLIKEEEQNGFYPKSWDEEVIAFKCLVDSMPSTEAKPIVHAHWIDVNPNLHIGMKCSLCGARIKYSEFFNGNHRYCHKCGARMLPISWTHENGVKIPVISIEDVPKLAKEMENNV